MRLPKYSQPPYSVSSDFGQLVGMRHLISGIDCAIAGAATAAAPTAPSPVTLMKSRRFMELSLDDCVHSCPSWRGLTLDRKHGTSRLQIATKKPGLSAKSGLEG